MTKLLALSLLVSTVLTGCGGSGGSDGGSTPTPSEKYTFEFVRMVTDVTVPENCTVFDFEGQNSDAATNFTYATLVSDVKVEIHKADGSLKSQTLTVSDDGSLTFSKDDIEDGGYISIIDSPSNDDPLYKVLSIQKELLGNYLIAVKRPQSSSACYTKGKGKITEVGYPLRTLNSDNIPADSYNYETSHSSTVIQSAREVLLEVYADEKILEKAYHNSKLVGYSFISGVSEDLGFTDTELVSIDDSFGFNHDSTTSRLTINIGNGDFIYPWYNVDLSSEVSFPYAYVEPNWFYNAGGQTATNWSFTRNGPILNALDIKLPDTLVLSATPPTISLSGNSFIFENDSLDTEGVNIQRSFYTQTSGPLETLNHSIYSVSDGSGDVVIPDLKLPNLAPLVPNAVEVSVLAMDNLQKDTVASFMRDEDSGDFVSIVLKPEDRIKHNKAINTNEYTIVER